MVKEEGVSGLFSEIPGQERAVTVLKEAVVNPVHAYLLLGPQGSGAKNAARDFAAALLCPDGGCGSCSTCQRVLSGVHPDLTIAEREGPSYRVDDIRRITSISQRRPLEASRTVVVIPDANLMASAAPAMLKTLEEPPVSTVFVLVADDLPRDMITIRSRCAVVSFDQLSTATISDWLVKSGLPSETANALAEGAAGDADRALLLAQDTGFAQRLDLWKRVPDLLDGTGSTAIELAIELNGSLGEAIEPLVAAHKAELSMLEEQAKSLGERGLPGRKEILDRFKREEKRYQTTELLAGLAVLARRYRDRMVTAERLDGEDSATTIRSSAAAIDEISMVAQSLRRNPRLPLVLERLFLELSRQA
jgi:DNA polymerase-3 subunit delta'